MAEREPATPSSPTVPAPPPLLLHDARGNDASPPTPNNALNSVRTAIVTRPASSLRRIWLQAMERMGCIGPDRVERRHRREVVRFCAFLVVTIGQVITIVVLTALAAVRTSPAPDHPGQTELGACSLLAAWNLIWLAKLVLRCYVVSWVVSQKWKRRARRARAARQLRTPPSPSATAARSDSNGSVQEERPPIGRTPSGIPAARRTVNLMALHLLLFRLDPFATIVWFFSTILIIYAHGSRCRVAASDVSAATYTILTIVYVQFVLNSFIPMIRSAMARRRAGRPVVQKLSRAEVDRIPLVLYIPPPPADTSHPAAPTSPPSPITPLPRSAAVPCPPPSSPKKKRRRFVFFRPTLKRRAQAHCGDVERALGGRGHAGADGEDGEDGEWERTWEPAAFPFVRLPENRATCMICLAEFEAPRRVVGHVGEDQGRDKEEEEDKNEDDDGDDDDDDYTKDGEAHEMGAVAVHGDATQGGGGDDIEEVRVESPRAADARAVLLADAGGHDAPEPLRLLSCGHVYHKDCIDPWLSQKSGRCPYCQARVEVPPPPPDKGRSSSNRRRGWFR